MIGYNKENVFLEALSKSKENHKMIQARGGKLIRNVKSPANRTV